MNAHDTLDPSLGRVNMGGIYQLCTALSSGIGEI
jgi:hypothetical protein